LDNSLTRYVKRARSFVKYQNFGLSDDASCDGYSLPLPTAKLDSDVSDSRVITFGKLRNELISVRFLTSLFNELFLYFEGLVFPLSANESIFNILEHGIIEEKWFLLDKADLRSPPCQIDFVDIFILRSYRTISEEKGL
jgi:hypothetical protein